MELTPVQQRTHGILVRPPPAGALPSDIAAQVREAMEARLDRVALPEVLWLSKARLNELERCEGTFAASLAGEREAFAHRWDTAIGAIAHRAAQADVAGERASDPRTVVEYALDRLLCEEEMARFWASLADLERAELLAGAVRQLVLFREMFPPLDRGWQPLSELPIQARLLGGRVVLLGRPDLVLGRPPQLPIDLKTGSPRAEHAEDGRYYALVMTLMFRRPPVRVATAYLDSLELQPEEVEASMLERAADRVVHAVTAAAELLRDRSAALTPGPHCGWCPRAERCPASAASVA